MCRADIDPHAQPLLADLLHAMAVALVRGTNQDPYDVLIGPVDFGVAEEEP